MSEEDEKILRFVKKLRKRLRDIGMPKMTTSRWWTKKRQQAFLKGGLLRVDDLEDGYMTAKIFDSEGKWI